MAGESRQKRAQEKQLRREGDKQIIGVDLFAGAGGLSLGARMAGIDVVLAVEKDKHAAATYSLNHAETTVLLGDIRELETIPVSKRGKISVLFGGPPCQGFSTSNQRTRSKENPNNWLFQEFLRLVESWRPDWVVFENVKGISETSGGFFRDSVLNGLADLGYTFAHGVFSALDFGVPQNRNRFFIVANRRGEVFDLPKSKNEHTITVRDAISDLPVLRPGASTCLLPYRSEAHNEFAASLRNKVNNCHNNLVSQNATHVIERYRHIPQGGNWQNIPDRLLSSYADVERCHTGIYRRLTYNKPSVVLGNFRKNMLIHPTQNRGLSVREAARLQSFPDNYTFTGSIGFQQQQVADAVPPLLAKAIFEVIMGSTVVVKARGSK